jgi:hypothetical protein
LASEWQFFIAYRAPEKRPKETPRGYLNRLDKWSKRKVAELRKRLRAKEDPRSLRRRWKGFALVIEVEGAGLGFEDI